MNTTNIIAKDFKHGENFKIGHYCVIGAEVTVGDNVTIENHCVLTGKVTIGNNTVVKNHVELRENTIIGNDCQIDSKVSSSGNCKIGNNVTLRYDTIVARGVEIGDNTYVCPRVMTNNLDTGKNAIGGAKIGKKCFIGTNAVFIRAKDCVENLCMGKIWSYLYLGKRHKTQVWILDRFFKRLGYKYLDSFG